jgi:hypothetical protein
VNLATIKCWWKSKIQINITIITPVEGVEHNITPRVIEKDVINIKRKRESEYRFIEEYSMKHDGKESTFWVTQRRVGAEWKTDYDTMSCTKEQALDLHLALVEKGTLKDPVSIKTVIWEGLDKSETKMMIALTK